VAGFLLGRAERVLLEESVDRGAGIANARREIVLGGMRFRAVVGDEQAKANANALAERRGRIGLEVSLRDLQFDLRNVLKVMPAGREAEDPAGKRLAYRSLDNLFEYGRPSELAPADGDRSVAGRVTCWGSGKINFKRAEVCVLREMLDEAVTESELADLVAFRDGAPDCTLAEALGAMRMTKDRAERLRGLMTDDSTCHSVWVLAEGAARNWYRFFVVEAARSPEKSARRVFAW
jgi:hypothetical protein